MYIFSNKFVSINKCLKCIQYTRGCKFEALTQKYLFALWQLDGAEIENTVNIYCLLFFFLLPIHTTIQNDGVKFKMEEKGSISMWQHTNQEGK